MMNERQGFIQGLGVGSLVFPEGGTGWVTILRRHVGADKLG